MIRLLNKRPLWVVGIATALLLPALYLVGSQFSRASTEFLTADLSDATPAGKLILDAATGWPAVAPLTVAFVRSPDSDGPGGQGRYLIAINSGYGLMFNARSKPQQTLSVIDLNAKPEPQVVQSVYFPAPQRANVGLVFDPKLQPDGKYRLFVSGGFENKVWVLGLDAKAAVPVSPANKPIGPGRPSTLRPLPRMRRRQITTTMLPQFIPRASR
jgi:hypothetical protein